MSRKLETRTISLNFAQGLDQKTDPKLTMKLTTADNVVFRKNGTIEKRPGFVSAGSWSMTPNPVRMFAFDDGVVGISDTSGATSAALNGWQRLIGKVGPSFTVSDERAAVFQTATIKTRMLLGDIASVSSIDAVVFNVSSTSSGVVHVGASGAGTYYRLGPYTRDLDSNKGTITNVFSNTGGHRCLSLTATSQTSYHVANFNPGGLAFYSVAAGSNTAALLSTISSVDVGPFDAVTLGGKIYFAVRAASSTNILLGWFDPSNSTTSTTTIPASTTADMITFATPAPGTSRLHLLWAKNTASNTAYFAAYSATLSQIVAATSFTSFTSAFGPGLVTQIAACENAALTGVYFYSTASSTTSMPVTTGHEILSLTGSVAAGFNYEFKACSLVSKPRLINGVPTVVLQNSATGQQSMLVASLLEDDEMHVIGKCLYGSAGPNGSVSYNNLAQISDAGNGMYYVPVRRANFFAAAAGSVTVAYSAELLEMNFSTTQSVPSVKLPGLTVFGGGFMSAYDGRGPTELGFLAAPWITTVSVSTAGGSLTVGTYSAVVVKEFVDTSGRYHVSQPSNVFTFTTSTTNSSATVSFVDTARSRRGRNAQGENYFVTYRTTANGTLYYRDARLFVGNLSAIAEKTQSVTISDSALSGGSAIYTQGGRLPAWTPDSCAVLFSHGPRLFCDDPSDGSLIRFSDEIISGEAPMFAFANTIPIEGPGRITAGASLGSLAVVFRQRSIHVFSGDGPDSTGVNGAFSSGGVLFADIGAINQRNVCRFRDGIVFKSPDKGFYLLTRDLQLQPIGAEVESYNSKTVVSSEVVGLNEASGSVEECRFLCSDGTLLTYNYYNGQWTTATLAGCTDAVQTGGRYVVANPSSTAANARVFQQSLTTYLDAFSNTSATYQMTVETGWYKIADVQGFQRVWKVQVLGEAHGDGSFSVEVGYDYESAYNEAHTATMSSLTAANYSGGATAIPQCDFVPTRQKCQAIRFRIKDYPGATGTVIKLTNISLECGVKTGLFKLPTSKGI